MANTRKTYIFDAFRAISAKHQAKTAVSFLGTGYSYARLLSLSERFAASLAVLGIGQGDRVIMYIPNSIHFVVCWLGIQRLGAVSVPVTPIYTTADLNYIATDTEAKAIICSDRNYGYVKQIMGKTRVQKVVVVNLADLLPFWKRAFGVLADRVPRGKVENAEFVVLFSRMVCGGSPAAPEPIVEAEDVAEILYTGGTTRHPKGVPITHGLFLESALEQLTVRDPLFPKDLDVVLGGAPLFHILGQTCGLATVVVGGGTLIVLPRVNLDAMFDSIQRMKATSLIGVPALYRMILEHDRVDQYDLSSLRYCFSAGDVLPMEVAKRWTDRFRRPVYQGYGATETCGGVRNEPHRSGESAAQHGIEGPRQEDPAGTARKDRSGRTRATGRIVGLFGPDGQGVPQQARGDSGLIC